MTTASSESTMKRSPSALKLAAIRNASLTAKESKEKCKPKSASDFCRVRKAAIEFQMLALQTELKLLEELSLMTNEERLVTLFHMLDANRDGKIDAKELADGLRKVRGEACFMENLGKAVDLVAKVDKDIDDVKELGVMVSTLAEGIGCTFHEVSDMLTMQVAFSGSANSMLENEVGNVVIDENREVKNTDEENKALMDKRVTALFNLFDIDNNGVIDFKEVVLGMYKLTENIDGASKAAVVALLMFDENESRSLNYEGFTKLMINIVASSPDHMKFDDIADSMTRMALNPIEISEKELCQLFALDRTINSFLGHIEEHKQDGAEQLNAIEYGKIDRLFNMWDLNSDGVISFHELALGLRKFQESTTLNETVGETIKIMNAFDSNSDEQLDRREFAELVAKFAKLSGADLMELIDFMTVTTALKENSGDEKAYIESLGASDIYYWGY